MKKPTKKEQEQKNKFKKLINFKLNKFEIFFNKKIENPNYICVFIFEHGVIVGRGCDDQKTNPKLFGTFEIILTWQ